AERRFGQASGRPGERGEGEHRFGQAQRGGDEHRFGEAERSGGERRFGMAREGEHAHTFGAMRRDVHGHAYSVRGHSFSPFRADRYRWPRGHSYRTYVLHERLPRVFWVHDYYISDWSFYGLYAPPRHNQWIRYGPDLLLVNLETGLIVDVVQGVFLDAEPADDPGPE
ncbi:MAG TPA: RcnB family protein, partial [Phenylobacterium sp.]|nr:RcnB family protein [Phenylobacterium sp.]